MDANCVEKQKGELNECAGHKECNVGLNQQLRSADALRKELEALFDKSYVLKLSENLQKAKS